jgi:periplasmic divalent cation tolerance protein
VAPDPTTGAILVLTTLPDAGLARDLVRTLVDRRLVACGTVIDRVTSVYRWEGTIEEAEEAQVILKARRGCWEALQAALTELHPYEVPEILALPVENGLPAYLAWVGTETDGKGCRG